MGLFFMDEREGADGLLVGLLLLFCLLLLLVSMSINPLNRISLLASIPLSSFENPFLALLPVWVILSKHKNDPFATKFKIQWTYHIMMIKRRGGGAGRIMWSIILPRFSHLVGVNTIEEGVSFFFNHIKNNRIALLGFRRQSRSLWADLPEFG